MIFSLQSTGGKGFILDTLLNLANDFLGAVPGVIGALVLLIIGLIAASKLSKLAAKMAGAIGLDKVSDKLHDVDFIRQNNIEISFEKILSKLVYYIIIIFFSVAAAEVLGIDKISDLISQIVNFIPNLIVAGIMLVGGVLIANALKGISETFLKSLGIGSAGVISTVIFFFVLINITMLALKQAGIETDFLARNISIVIGGVVIAFALGYGLASKDIMANFVSSMYSKELFKVGTKVTIDGVTGTICEVTSSSVVLETENSTVRFPLSKAVSGKIEFHK